jgi:hypothetical protein
MVLTCIFGFAYDFFCMKIFLVKNQTINNLFRKYVLIFFCFSDLLSCNGNKKNMLNDYDTGIGSTTTLLSPLGSPQPTCRSHVKTNGHFTSYMQVGLASSTLHILIYLPMYFSSNDMQGKSHSVTRLAYKNFSRFTSYNFKILTFEIVESSFIFHSSFLIKINLNRNLFSILMSLFQILPLNFLL